MINIAVIGAGAISGFHIEGYLAFPGRCRIVSVVDIDRAKAQRQIERYGLDAVAADDIAGVVDGPGIGLASVCTPPGTHAEIAVRLLEAGVHGRTFILGTEGYLELRKYTDVAREPGGDHVYLVDADGERHIPVAGRVGYPFFGQLILDCLEGTERAMSAEHAFRAAELCLQAEATAMRIAG